jgi:hypothetical protein
VNDKNGKSRPGQTKLGNNYSIGHISTINNSLILSF